LSIESVPCSAEPLFCFDIGSGNRCN
jgi:hypothetical protein